MTIEYSDDMNNALAVLKRGGIILYPTDTIWGIGCDATNSEAIKRIYTLKKRADSKSMLVLVNNKNVLKQTVDNIPDIAWDLLDLTVNPLTIIYDNAKGVAPELTAEDGSLGIRITKEKFSQELCHRLGHPIVSTSANVSGQPSPAFFDEISDDIKNGVDYIVSYRRSDKNNLAPSNIIKLSEGGKVKIIR